MEQHNSYCFCDNGWPEGQEMSGGEFEKESPKTEKYLRGHYWVTLQLQAVG